MAEEKKSTYTGQTDARRKASAKYLSESVEDVRIRVPKGKKSIIKAHAEQQNESMNQFVIRAINETMERDNTIFNPNALTSQHHINEELEFLNSRTTQA